MPYRSRKHRQVAKVEEGLVADMVRQFADPWAFVRELVQNGIDAGATELEVGARREGSDGGRFWIRDDGVGMDRAVIEGPLLTLFASAKDDDETKIGKYGVGFVSVFAIEPDEVVVETWRADEAWRLRLFPDHRYELSHLERRPPTLTGTAVTLLKSFDGDGYRAAADEVGSALRRWCRHAHLPITWREGEREPDRVDRPVGVESAVTVRTEAEGLRAVVGIAPDPRGEGPRASYGFYQRGLTLIETTEAPHRSLAGLRCKVDSAALKHTISRDDVRHDRAYVHAVRQLLALAGEPLTDALVEALAREAAAVADGGEATAYLDLLRAALRMGLGAEHIAIPLTMAVDGSTWVVANTFDSLWHPPWAERAPLLFATTASPLVARLATEGHSVIRSDGPTVALLVGELLQRDAQPVDEAFALLESVPDERFVDEVKRALVAAGVVPPGLHLVSWPGPPGRAAFAVPPGTPPFLIECSAPTGWSASFGAVGPMALAAEHPAVAAARARGDEQAAWLLVRYLLVEEFGVVSRGRAEGLWRGEEA